MMDVKRIISKIEKGYIKNNLKKEQRVDGRGLWDYRDFEIKTGIITAAEGSCDISLGGTRIMIGVKYDVGTPFPDTPDEGVCTVMAELLPLASPLFERGPPDEESIELARVVDRGIRHADCVQTKKLCIQKDEAVYIIFIDMYVINHSGNMIDCGAVGSLAALLSAKIPQGKWTENGPEWTGEYISGKDIINELPLAITFGKIDDMLFLDPNLAEELVSDGRITISVTKDQITSIQKSGSTTFEIDEIKMLSKKAFEAADKLREDLNLWQYAENIEEE
ncbi:MAG: exosome complex protein Rrp42 [Candidatus Lokiarchaeota archaeon]|nr:exosome complex protein Rrp42 [Candidatus Lokiarchaeota archaeon]MBD3199330.1 exosome complex protein Rrp42 [Candidatus Lokiarchaeota archaeon]